MIEGIAGAKLDDPYISKGTTQWVK